ncbi:MAG: PIN domain-containing protein [Phycisphaerae bacterium]|nr:PIN domain-containing protein [Phycisphaerae bacterium]
MLLLLLRVFFLFLVSLVVTSYYGERTATAQIGVDLPVISLWMGAIGVAIVLVALDLLIAEKSIRAIGAIIFGLAGGLLMSVAASIILNLLIQTYAPMWEGTPFHNVLVVLLGVCFCYLSISFVLQTKDDFRLVIPYVQFSKQTKGGRPMLLDTSVIIDGRIADICETRILESELLVPRFILQELQNIADSSDRLKRNRGRCGLDVLNKLQTNHKVDVTIYSDALPDGTESEPVDSKLVQLARKLNGRVITNDYNLNKVAQIHGVDVININDLSNALKPIVLPGESMSVKIIKPGEEAGQGVGYLEDGTMVVVEQARDKIGQTLNIGVTSVLQTSAGRMIFGRIGGVPALGDRERRPRRGQSDRAD